MVLHQGLCATHRIRRNWLIALGWAGFIGGMAAIVRSADLPKRLSTPILILGGILILCSLIALIVLNWYFLRATRISDLLGTFKGAGSDYLAQFPASNRPGSAG